MKCFAACVLAASVIAVPIKDGALADAIVLDNLSAKVVEQVVDGDIAVLDSEVNVLKDVELTIDTLKPVDNNEDQVKAIITQIEAGFAAITSINDDIEENTYATAAQDLVKLINEIMAEAQEEAAHVISDESEESEQQKEMKEIFEEANKHMAEVQQEHDKELVAAAKTALVAEVTNDAVKGTLLDEVMGLVGTQEASLNDWITKQELPFDIQSPPMIDDTEPAELKLERIVCRSGDCVDEFKKDPEFDDFLAGVIKGTKWEGIADEEGWEFTMPEGLDVLY